MFADLEVEERLNAMIDKLLKRLWIVADTGGEGSAHECLQQSPKRDQRRHRGGNSARLNDAHEAQCGGECGPRRCSCARAEDDGRSTPGRSPICSRNGCIPANWKRKYRVESMV